MRFLIRGTLVLLYLIVLVSSVYPFGKNKVQYKNFEWYYIQSEHFDIYFYEDAIQIARFTAAVAESAYVAISSDFNYTISKRIPIILYKSHNDFQQTNVVIEYMEEGIGGVTELLKNRMVIPFEGDYEQFRHVIHHELVHAVMNDMLYGGSLQQAIQRNVSPVPLWVSEGLAEFESEGWNNRLDMAVRDGVINAYFPELEYLEYVSPYQGGASVFRFIAETYGREKIGEFLNRLKGKLQFEGVIQQTFQMNLKEFSERWMRWLKKMYWLDYANRQAPKEIANPVTDHVKQRNYLNVSPAISPDGQYIAFISDKDGYQNIVLYSTLKEKIVSEVITGTRSESFEELHFLRPGISFSPDGTKLAFTAKSDGRDWIYIKNIKTGDLEKLKLDLDGVYTVSWSPDGKYIAFVGNEAEKSDLYMVELSSKQVTNLTNDIFTDDMPSWSRDGKKIVFVSDRGNYGAGWKIPVKFEMSRHNYKSRDIYIYDLEMQMIQRVTDTPYIENFPIFADQDQKILYTSDENGIFNLYEFDLQTKSYRALTDVYTGIYQLSITPDDQKLIFVSYDYGGFDIYIMSNPLEKPSVMPAPTYFVQNRDQIARYVYFNPKEKEQEDQQKRIRVEETLRKNDYTHFVFKPDMYRAKEEVRQKKTEDVILPKSRTQTDSGDYYVRKYKIKITPDLVIGQAGYNTFFGIQGYTQFAFSDLMGDYQIYLNTNLVYDLRNSDYALIFANLKHRLDYGVGIFHNADYFFGDYGLQRFRNYGASLFSAYGLSRYRRIEAGMTWFNVKLEYLDVNREDQFATTILPQISYVFDNVLYSYTGPAAGTRYYFSVLSSPKYTSESREFTTFTMDFRKYFLLNRDYQFAIRFNAGVSVGADPQTFFLGGIDNWINRKFNGGIRIENIDDIYFSSFVTPLRGLRYYEGEGNRFFLTNLEFRFPMIKLVSFGLPPITLGNVRGVLFTDFGSAWTEDTQSRLRFFENIPGKGMRTKDLLVGYGLGTRVFLFGLILRVDVAWRWLGYNSTRPTYMFSIGGDI